ncbi:MAG: hypothetical protein QM820_21980 [Minicystis sp.]
MSASSGSAIAGAASMMTPWMSRPAEIGHATAYAQPAAANAVGPISWACAVDTACALTSERACVATCARNQLDSVSGRRSTKLRRYGGSPRWATSSSAPSCRAKAAPRV